MTTSRRRSLHEAAHKTEAPARDEPGQSPVVKRSFNEAAHKLGYFAPSGVRAHAEESEATRRRFEALADSNRDVIAHGGMAVLALGALAVHLLASGVHFILVIGGR